VLLPARYLTYLADPFVVSEAGVVWIFAEEYLWPKGSGRLVAWKAEDPSSRRIVLAGAHHYSFPQVRRVGTSWIGTCESCATPQSLFAFDKLGDPWTVVAGAELPALLTDPQLEYSEAHNKWFLIATEWGADEGPVCRWETDDPLRSDSWRRSTSAASELTGRGGGTYDPAAGVRACQVGLPTYGFRVAIQDLNSGTVVINDEVQQRTRGWHTLAWEPTRESAVNAQLPYVFDEWTQVVDPLAIVWKYLELRHHRSCRARTLRELGSTLGQ
jgi:hypothetical protein